MLISKVLFISSVIIFTLPIVAAVIAALVGVSRAAAGGLQADSSSAACCAPANHGESVRTA